MKSFTLTLNFEKSTKNKHVFSHPDVGGFYIPKELVGTPIPTAIQVNFSEDGSSGSVESNEPEM